MNATYGAVLVTTRTALQLLDETIAQLPGEALDWVPAPGVNSVTVLVRHSVTATAFLAATGAGLGPDRERYLAGDRAEAFAATSATLDGLRREIAAFDGRLESILGAGSEETLARPAGWAWPDGRVPSCGEVLVHSLGHLKEHVGQVQLMRDLWKVRPGA